MKAFDIMVLPPLLLFVSLFESVSIQSPLSVHWATLAATHSAEAGARTNFQKFHFTWEIPSGHFSTTS